MKAAVAHGFNGPPRYGDFAEPNPGDDEILVTVSAAALSNFTRLQISGHHYSSQAIFPCIPGADGVGRLDDGRRVYFVAPAKPYGSMAELAAVKKHLCIPLPDDVDDVTAAAAANAGMSSWAGLTERAKLVAGESVLINGATGVSGRLAIQVAKHLGAGKVIATGRNPDVLKTLPALGADVVIALDRPADELVKIFREQIRSCGVGVILDYLWGASAEHLIAAISGGGSGQGEPRIRFVQVGSIAGPTIALPAAALRSSGLEILGSGLGSLSQGQFVTAVVAVMKAIVPAKLAIATEAVPLRRIESAWSKDPGGNRLVFTL
jgi:NADPH:quinone reductase-like Zn-dependent oxidoreductase